MSIRTRLAKAATIFHTRPADPDRPRHDHPHAPHWTFGSLR